MTQNSSAGRGALAQVIATRGGRAAPESPFVIEHREALIYMLCEAAELEHAIMCQYLFAAFSLKQSTEEGLTADELAAVDRWRKAVSQIATQEMLHLALVQNILSAVGAAPHLSRPNLPQPAGHYPPGVVLTLLPFGQAALEHFMFLERPEGMDLADASGLAAVDRAAPAMQEGEIVPRLQDFATVGHLYRSIEEGIKHLCDKYGEPWLFVGPSEAQAAEAHFGWQQLVQVVDEASAQRAIDTILEQGEGPRGHWRKAHFGLFVEILDEYQQLKDANPDFEPARPVLPATVRPFEGEQDTPLIEDRYTSRCVDLFNVSYEVLLQTLARYFAHTEETEPQLASLAQVTLGLMFNVIKPLGQLITTLPVGDGYPGKAAGPSFELFYESDYVIPHRDAAWALMEERLREASAFSDRLRNEGPPEVASRLESIGSGLLMLAHQLATCRASWGGRDHTGVVTVSHRRRDAERARANPDVNESVDRLTEALRRALRVEQALALRTLLAAASGPKDDPAMRASNRTLFAECERRFDRLFNLADLLVGVNGDTEIESPDFASTADQAISPDYEEITRLVLAVPSGALLVDPHPSPTYAPEERRQHLPGIVDTSSAVALIQKITDSRASDADPGIQGPVGAVAGATLTGPSVGDAASIAALAVLFKDAYDVLRSVLGRTVGDERDAVAARHRLHDIATRLRSRVLRPIAEALCQQTSEPIVALAEAYRSGNPDESLDTNQKIRSLAVTATETRVDLKDATPEVLEATAALQDLALTFACATEADRTLLLDRFGNIGAVRPMSIQLVRNGPYILTNVTELSDALGDPVSTRPQMALCRCGQSADKPWCDGSHALADFQDSKDPNRVGDRRDTYAGVSITVFDNRGICQHSGYCTDRLPSAFRIDKEPFVAVSGARVDEVIRAVRDCPSGALSFAIDDYEERDQVDWHNRRAAGVTVAKDGPYRVTGSIPLVEPTGDPVARNEGVSTEHYALCRCGHSQNKPFCSGMHWYVQFRDPVPDPRHTPSLYEWSGGRLVLNRLTRLLFEKYIPEDPLLGPLFADATAEQPERLAALIGDALGGPPIVEEHRREYADMVSGHDGRAFSEPERARWVRLIVQSANDVGLPNDAEFRAAFTSYLEWASRQTDAVRLLWDWGPGGPPKPPTEQTGATEEVEEEIPDVGTPLSFDRHIRPLFRERDRQSMSFAFDLWSYDDVKEHARSILERLRAGNMPCDGAWPERRTDLFQRWVDEGTPS
ncbi:MAG TPA: ferritin-like domain-containing protein [Acidimicrobiales bacterium]|nr:ferritin-like domain-containing protein [Acidimicrobiales bacterium]